MPILPSSNAPIYYSIFTCFISLINKEKNIFKLWKKIKNKKINKQRKIIILNGKKNQGMKTS